MIVHKLRKNGRNRRAQGQNFARLRVGEFQAVGMEKHSRAGVFCDAFVQFKITVFIVADNRMADGRAVYADLVGATGEDFHTHGGEIAHLLVHIELGVGALSFAFMCDDHAAFAIAGDVFVQRRFDVGDFFTQLAL